MQEQPEDPTFHPKRDSRSNLSVLGDMHTCLCGPRYTSDDAAIVQQIRNEPCERLMKVLDNILNGVAHSLTMLPSGTITLCMHACRAIAKDVC